MTRVCTDWQEGGGGVTVAVTRLLNPDTGPSRGFQGPVSTTFVDRCYLAIIAIEVIVVLLLLANP